MALIVLIFAGSLLGWIATIITRVEDRGGILTHVLIGIISAVVVGVFINSGSFIGGLSALALVGALVGASVVLAAYAALRRKTVSE